MQLATVIGDGSHTEGRQLHGRTLPILQPIGADATAGRADARRRGRGGCRGGRDGVLRPLGSEPVSPDEVPADAGVVGIVDHWDTES